MNQKDIVLNRLKKHKRGITSMQAITRYGITRLASRIHHLRDEGHDISTTRETNDAGKNWARYKLVKLA